MRVITAGENLVEVASSLLAGRLADRLEEQARVSLALSGGRTPWPVFQSLSDRPLDWSRVDVYQVDERVAPAGDQARNWTGLCTALLDRVPAKGHPMPVEAFDLDAAAAEYDAALPDAIDIVHLGLGDDGHTASLIAGDAVLEFSNHRVGLTETYRGHRRMTLTFPALARAREIVWIVAGKGKEDIVERLLAADPSIPAGRVPQSHAVLITGTLDSRARQST